MATDRPSEVCLSEARGNVARPLLLAAGFACAIALRVAIGHPDISQSAAAGLSFAGVLFALAALSKTRLRPSWGAVLAGVAVGGALCAPVTALRFSIGSAHRPAGSFVHWASIVAVVAVAEEVFLRGALYEAVQEWLGVGPAIWVGAVAFALLHAPLYGWRAMPLDLAVGLILGWLRDRTASPTAPAAAHVTADLLAWWLR